ncbi:DNA-binding transcription factor ADR1 KNAG_0A04460 [Huiozyma naganishii CBS 8797]|uniref:C2H2-type domain-containing protein n=1 Tax=Huiozyma naganishii (strain ATCC MYA-139 / BCRC 22969 / CBS 8797 / KCTC 17520 / NBRC 10181 / NCYC 3082 / Yp74L-3) TaxID=1071383 RepID=J7S2D9_HUIN7|nr:hypothetical protein KNAG_0A04460 [Kazachstania naganishii CBS 8797]CCK68119.1 hypothetical protein KNAG_0A04460 [Kazachstania naganishii CBS 8797]
MSLEAGNILGINPGSKLKPSGKWLQQQQQQRLQQQQNDQKKFDNRMNSKGNRKMKYLPDNLKLNGVTPSGKPRRFVCKVCTRAFARSEHLERHERSHTNEKPYECGICDRMFTRRDLLLRHALKTHNGNCGNTIVKRQPGRRRISSTSGSSTKPRATQRSSVVSSITTACSLVSALTQNDSLSAKSMSSISSVSPGSNLFTDVGSLATTPLSTSGDGTKNEVGGQRRRKFSVGKKPAQTKDGSELRRKPVRRVSFSAQSAANYAVPVIQPNDYPTLDRIQFSTPELLPVEFNYMLHNDLIDGGSDPKNTNASTLFPVPPEFSLSDGDYMVDGFSLMNLQADPVKVQQQYTDNFLPLDDDQTLSVYPNTFNSDSFNAPSFPNQNLLTKNDKHSVSTVLSSDNYSSGTQSSLLGGKENDILSKLSSLPGNDHEAESLNYTKTTSRSASNNNAHGDLLRYQLDADIESLLNGPPLSTETSDELSNSLTWDTPNTASPGTVYQSPGQLILQQHNRNELNTLSDVTKYSQSIYNNFIKQEEVEWNLNSENAMMENMELDVEKGGELKMTNDNYTLYGLDNLTMTNISKKSPSPELRTDVVTDDIILEECPVDTPPPTLFTTKLRDYCSVVLKFYEEKCGNSALSTDPVLISKKLMLPSVHELNQFLALFRKRFLIHYPFIHASLLNADFLTLQKYLWENDSLEDKDIEFDSERDILHIARSVCLPLLMVALGSLYKKGCHGVTVTLYEMGRRAIHVFLETKKKYTEIRNLKAHSQYTWLVQTLTLNIIFALFAVEVEDVEAHAVKRQVAAVCSVVKSGLLYGISEVGSASPNSGNDMDFPSASNYILFESKIRCTLMIYRYCQYLKIFYNVQSNYFLNETDIDEIYIPDEEQKWLSASVICDKKDETRNNTMKKQNITPFKRFYTSFTFNDLGVHPIPESLVATMMFYEFNSNYRSPFNLFLTKIVSKKLETNSLPPSNTTPIACTRALIGDCTILKNCLMVMKFFFEIDKGIGSKVWKGDMTQLYDSFLNPKSVNLLTKGSYNLLTDLLVSLKSSVQNITKVLVQNKVTNLTSIDKEKLTIFNIHGYFYNFLAIIKFILDFEATPNFKLLSVFIKLNKLANDFLIPSFALSYPKDFRHFNKVKWTVNYSQSDVNKIERAIKDVLVYSFNDTSFLNMSDQAPNEFLFHDVPNGTNKSQYDGLTDGATTATQSSVDLLLARDKAKHQEGHAKQSFAERYQLSSKFISIAKCFFKVTESSYAHCNILAKVIEDFEDLGRISILNSNEKELSKSHLNK